MLYTPQVAGGILLMSFPLAMFVFVPFGVYRKINKHYRQNPGQFQVEYIIDEQSVQCKSYGLSGGDAKEASPNKTVTEKWSGYQEAFENKSFFCLKTDPRNFRVIPKRVLSQDQIAELRSYMQNVK